MSLGGKSSFYFPTNTPNLPGPITFRDILLQYASDGAFLDHYVGLCASLNLMLRCVAHCCSENAYMRATYIFLQPDDFPVLAPLYSPLFSFLNSITYF